MNIRLRISYFSRTWGAMGSVVRFCLAPQVNLYKICKVCLQQEFQWFYTVCGVVTVSCLLESKLVCSVFGVFWSITALGMSFTFPRYSVQELLLAFLISLLYSIRTILYWVQYLVYLTLFHNYLAIAFSCSPASCSTVAHLSVHLC